MWINLNPTKGDEKKKTRPCLVLQSQITPLNLITVLPITDASKKRKAPFFVTINPLTNTGLKKKSAIDCYQIRTLSLERVVEKMGNIDQRTLDAVKSSLALILEIHSYHIRMEID